MRANLHSFGLELIKLSAPQGFVRAIRERGLRRVMKEYLNHSALNAGQAARDLRYFFDHPAADKIGGKGIRRALLSAKERSKSLANNTFYAAIPPHMHHEAAELIAKKPVRAKAMFLRGYNPWDYPDPTRAQ